MAFKGFNASEVNSCLNRIKNSYDEIQNLLVHETQSIFLNALSEVVYSEEFVEYANGTLVEALNKSVKYVYDNFSNILASVVSAGRAWAEATKSTEPVNSVEIDGSATVNASCFQSVNAANQRGADEEVVTDIVAAYKGIVEEINGAIERAKSAVVNSGFIGGSSESFLVNTLNIIGSMLATNIDNVSVGVTDAVKSVVEKYSVLESDVANAFDGQ